MAYDKEQRKAQQKAYREKKKAEKLALEVG